MQWKDVIAGGRWKVGRTLHLLSMMASSVCSACVALSSRDALSSAGGLSVPAVGPPGGAALGALGLSAFAASSLSRHHTCSAPERHTRPMVACVWPKRGAHACVVCSGLSTPALPSSSLLSTCCGAALWLSGSRPAPHHTTRQLSPPQTRRGQVEASSYGLTPLHAELVPLEMMIAWLLMGLLSDLVAGT
jgi:hypothetical protein